MSRKNHKIDWLAVFAATQKSLAEMDGRLQAVLPRLQEVITQRGNFQAEVSRLEKKVEELDAELDKTRALHMEAVRLASDVQQELLSAQRDTTSLGDVSGSVNKGFDGFSQAEDDLLTQNRDLHYQVADLEKKLAQKEKSMALMADDLKHQREIKKRADTEQIKALRDRIDVLQTDATEARKQKEAAEARLEAMDKELKETKERSGIYYEELNQALVRMNKAEKAEYDLGHLVEELRAETKESKTSAEQFNRYITVLSHTITDQRAELAAKTGLVEVLKDKIKDLESKVKEYRTDGVENLQELEELRAKVRNDADDVGQALRLRDSCNTTFVEMEAKEAVVQMQLANAKDKIKQLEDELHNLKQELKDRQQFLDAVMTDKLSDATKIKELEQEATDAVHGRDMALEQLKEAKTETGRLGDLNRTLQFKNEELEEAKADLEAEKEELEQEVDKQFNELQGQNDISIVLGLQRGFEVVGAKGRYAVFRVREGEHWVGFITRAYYGGKETLVDVMWYAEAGAAGMVISSEHNRQTGVSTKNIKATLVRVPNTDEQTQRLFDYFRLL